MDTQVKSTPGSIVCSLADAPTVPCPCGQSPRPLTIVDTPTCNLHVTFITDSVHHSHRQCAEVDMILEGTGTLELNDDRVEGTPGTVVSIETGTRYRLSRVKGVQAVVFGVPALLPDDEFFD